MNKARRHELKMLKYKKRIKRFRHYDEDLILRKKDANYYAFRSHGKPCSCCICRNEKYRDSRQKNKKLEL